MGLEKKLFLVLEHMLLGYTSASLPLSVENVCLTCKGEDLTLPFSVTRHFS